MKDLSFIKGDIGRFLIGHRFVYHLPVAEAPDQRIAPLQECFLRLVVHSFGHKIVNDKKRVAFKAATYATTAIVYLVIVEKK